MNQFYFFGQHLFNPVTKYCVRVSSAKFHQLQGMLFGNIQLFYLRTDAVGEYSRLVGVAKFIHILHRRFAPGLPR